ncbi:MAG: hypothetical protein QOD67_2352 [Caballeronia sp.]|jgi:threonine/homoserine/homoserine lactone efflux protein|nr:hypothetical protein [Caballeronia sp.]
MPPAPPCQRVISAPSGRHRFPQFMRPVRGSLAIQSLILGTTLAVMAVAWNGLVVMLTGRFRETVALMHGNQSIL